GVEAGSIIRRAAFALRFGDPNFILSGQINPTSRVMYIRNINDRVRKAAPFLKYDADPYAVVLNGNVYWVVDAYTTTDNYPYAQNADTSGVTGASQLASNSGFLQSIVGSNGQLVPAPIARLQPQYVLAHPPGSTQQSFLLLTPFVPVGSGTERQNLTALMTASSDPSD